MDKNKDGYITKGELKLAKKNVGMKQIDEVIKKYDLDKDGKLDMEEFKKSSQWKSNSISKWREESDIVRCCTRYHLHSRSQDLSIYIAYILSKPVARSFRFVHYTRTTTTVK